MIRLPKNQCKCKSSNDGVEIPRETESKRAWTAAGLGIVMCDLLLSNYVFDFENITSPL